MSSWEPVVGLEIHVHLKTRTKMFCRCELAYGAPENTRTCPVCLAHPGSLPVPNERAVEWTIKLGLALGCEIAPRALFHRKNYFYRDLPKGYQISQYDEPLCLDGRFVVPRAGGDLEVGIVRAHLEEDAAKSVHVGGAEMERGSLRVDANVSVRPAGSSELRTRWELKNMNSFNFIARGIEQAIADQVALYESGGEPVQDTYDFDPSLGALTRHRSKEEADDYRYFPEPDLVPIEPARDLVERLRAELPELPGARVRRLEPAVGFDLANDLVTSARDRLYERLLSADALEPRLVANAVMNEIAGAGVDPDAVNAEELAKVLRERERLPRDVYADAIAASASPGFAAARYLEQTAITDASELGPLVDRILAANEAQVAAYRAGKEGLLGFFVGQVMRETKGKADPRAVNELLREKLRA